MKNAKNGEVSKAQDARYVRPMNASVGATFAVAVAVSLVPIEGSIALVMALFFLIPVAIISYTFR